MGGAHQTMTSRNIRRTKRTCGDEIDHPDDAGGGDAVGEDLEALVGHLEQPILVGEDAVAVDDEEGETAGVPDDGDVQG